MHSNNHVTIATAGSGKTQMLVQVVAENRDRTFAIVTFTRENADEIRVKFYELYGCIPDNVDIDTWFSFLLRHAVRPYANCLYEPRIDGINLVSGRSDRYAPKSDMARYYFANGQRIYTDKISDFALRCEAQSEQRVTRRLGRIFDCIMIDEVQDLAGYDLDFLELIGSTDIQLRMVGDYRQATYATNQAARHKKYRGAKIVDLFKDWDSKGFCSLSHSNHSYRCNQSICDFAHRFFPDGEKAISLNTNLTDHDGIFVVRTKDVPAYIKQYRPQILRYSVRTNVGPYPALNFGASKGKTYDRVLIFPTNSIKKFLKTGDLTHVQKSLDKAYVAVTRARASVAFVLDDDCAIPGVRCYQPST